jgi:opacity protein-like surface antigen
MRSTRPLLASILSLALVTSVPALAGRTDQGTVEAGAAFSLDFEGANGATLSGDFLGGYFIMDGVLLGGTVGVYNDDALTLLSGFATVEQHFETDSPWLPYVGAKLGVMHSKADFGDSSDSITAMAIGATGGIKFYITEMAALDLSLNFVLASDDVFVADGEPESFDIALKGGLRFFLF